jgi:hypothetical protein
LSGPRDEFLSEEDLDFGRLSPEEQAAWVWQWLLMAQTTNDQDAGAYSHGVFVWDPAVPRPPWGVGSEFCGP